MNYNELCNILRIAASQGRTVEAFVTFTKDSFPGKKYSKRERTYVFTSDNKAFRSAGGYSIFADCLDKADLGVRLERYMCDEKGGPDGWKIEDCGLIKYQLIYIYERDMCVKGYYDNEREARKAMKQDLAKIVECKVEELDALIEEGEIEGECDDDTAWLNFHGNSDWTIVPIFMNETGVVDFNDDQEDENE